jgi:hypothetical protein
MPTIVSGFDEYRSWVDRHASYQKLAQRAGSGGSRVAREAREEAINGFLNT